MWEKRVGSVSLQSDLSTLYQKVVPPDLVFHSLNQQQI